MTQSEHTAQKASYRRGTIMGLTAAEAFMLICFILLMLLMLWRAAAEENLRVAEEFGGNFTEEEKKLALANKDRLAELDSALEDIEAMRPLLEMPGMTPEKLVTAIELQERLGSLDPDLLDDRLRLVADEDIRRAAEALQTVEAEDLLKLVDMLEADKVQEVIEATELNATPDEVERLREENEEMAKRLVEFDASGLTPEDIRDLARRAPEISERLAAYEETGLQPDDVEALSNAVSEVEAARKRLDATGADIAKKLRDNVGPKIADLGGRILDSGDVIFPDRLLFGQNSAKIEPEFDDLLKVFCRPWFEVLYAEQASLETVQIEGHASSEFGNLPDRAAFDRNLDLSQRRSAAVFRRCLDYGGSDEIAAWARATTAAVGYSSSRVVFDAAGQEDRRASRRVVFAIDMRSEDEVIASTLNGPTSGQRGGAPAPNPSSEIVDKSLPDGQTYRARGYSPLIGLATHVRDGDTLEVAGQPIRLEGLHVPELSTPLGKRAREFLTDAIYGHELTCWLNGKRTRDRKVGVCFLNDQDISALMIQNGFGQDCPAFSDGRYSGIATSPAFDEQTLPKYCKR